MHNYDLQHISWWLINNLKRENWTLKQFVHTFVNGRGHFEMSQKTVVE